MKLHKKALNVIYFIKISLCPKIKKEVAGQKSREKELKNMITVVNNVKSVRVVHTILVYFTPLRKKEGYMFQV